MRGSLHAGARHLGVQRDRVKGEPEQRGQHGDGTGMDAISLFLHHTRMLPRWRSSPATRPPSRPSPCSADTTLTRASPSTVSLTSRLKTIDIIVINPIHCTVCISSMLCLSVWWRERLSAQLDIGHVTSLCTRHRDTLSSSRAFLNHISVAGPVV